MKVFVDQSLVDSGDPLALRMLEMGSHVSKMVPVSEWRYCICKVTYYRGSVDFPDSSRKIKEGYLFCMDSGIADQVDMSYFTYDWFTWEVIEGDIKVPKSPGFARVHKTIEDLKGYYKLS